MRECGCADGLVDDGGELQIVYKIQGDSEVEIHQTAVGLYIYRQYFLNIIKHIYLSTPKR